MADISFNIACKELKIAQIPQLNQFFVSGAPNENIVQNHLNIAVFKR